MNGNSSGYGPVRVVMYARLARREEADMLAEFGDEYRRYAERTPRFLPQGRPEAQRKDLAR